MPSPFHFQLARTAPEFEAAFRLLQAARRECGLEQSTAPLWLIKQHALPSTNTVVAMLEGRVVGALCLFGDNPFHLPLEEHLDLKSLRRDLEGRIAEISIAAFEPEHSTNPELLCGLFHFALCFGTTYCHYDGFVMEATVGWAKEFGARLGFSGVYEPIHGRRCLYVNARDANGSAHGNGEFRFPENKFFHVAHQSMCPAVLNYLFNERTQLFASLCDADLRVLKSIYDWGDYAKLLPGRPHLPAGKRSPRFPRFPMSCEGFLVNERGGREHVKLLDVSREGLKIRIEQAPDRGVSYVLTLFVGVNCKTELIAHTVWIDEKASIAGLEVRSGDSEWARLVEYLEKDFLRTG